MSENEVKKDEPKNAPTAVEAAEQAVKVADASKSKNAKIGIDWDWMKWQTHAFIIMGSVIASMLVAYPMYLYWPAMFGFFLVLTMTTNIIALVYAVFAYYIFDSERQKAVKKLKEKGIEIMSLEAGLSILVDSFQKVDVFYMRNKAIIDVFMKQLETVNLAEVMKTLEGFTRVATTLNEMGWNAETLEKIKPSLIQIAAVTPKFAELLPDIARLLAVADTDKLKSTIQTAIAMATPLPERGVAK